MAAFSYRGGGGAGGGGGGAGEGGVNSGEAAAALAGLMTHQAARSDAAAAVQSEMLTALL